MKNIGFVKIKVLLFFALALTLSSCVKTRSESNLAQLFVTPPEEARPWAYWYWMHGALSKDGLTRDLEAMKEAGFEGAYIFTIRGVPEEALIEPSYHQLSDEWWEMVVHAIAEADRLGLQIGYHVSDGFALAGGPWISPELSMQKVVWSEQVVAGDQRFSGRLEQPETIAGHYRDLGVYAYPAVAEAGLSTRVVQPRVTSSIPGVDASVLVKEGNEQTVGSNQKCWIQYAFDEPFMARSLTVNSQWADYQSRRFLVQVSDDGVHFEDALRLEPPRMGWQDYEFGSTFALGELSARYFRFVFDPAGSEPGAEDLDPAKWSPRLRLRGLELFGSPRINQFEGKSGSVWRISPREGTNKVPENLYVDSEQLIDLSDKMGPDGQLDWEVPPGKWTIIRMGYTSNGHTNATGGAAVGLEADKLNPEAVRLQFENWFGAAIDKVGPDLADVISMFHVDSWECGSQNWSPVFRDAFMEKRGYDPLPYLPVMAGVPLGNPEISERFLFDVRETVADLVAENFFGTLEHLARDAGADFSAECLSPVFISDDMEHYRHVNYPMGEFWLNSPSHDKPNDILDAISGARMYGHNIVQAEAFTQVRIEWDEHPGMLKTLGDQYFALGINRFVFHVFMHNPWMTERQPGMTLDGIGLFVQPDQTWWEAGKAWFDYIARSQALLQQGHPVVDIAVFTGEEVPRRALLPDRLVKVLPGLFGPERVTREKERLANESLGTRERPVGVNTSENMAVWEDWSDPLNGYAYDSFNRDALLHLASVEDGRIVLPGGSSYAVLVVPGARAMMPNGNRMSLAVARRLVQLAKDGATLVFEERPERTLGLEEQDGSEAELKALMDELFGGEERTLRAGKDEQLSYYQVGKGRVLKGSYQASSLRPLMVDEDLIIRDRQQRGQKSIAWNHRQTPDADIYFLSNQLEASRSLDLSFRVKGRQPWIYNAVDASVKKAGSWEQKEGRTQLRLDLEANEAVFVVFEGPVSKAMRGQSVGENSTFKEEDVFAGPWTLTFDERLGGPSESLEAKRLFDWTTHPDERISAYSGTVQYVTEFEWTEATEEKEYWLSLGTFHNIAALRLNGVDLGVLWTPPYRLEVGEALKVGRNRLEIALTNTWRNRLLADRSKAPEDRIADYFGRWYIEGKSPMPAGLLGPVVLKSRPLNPGQDH